MLARFLQDNALEGIAAAPGRDGPKRCASHLVKRGHAVIPKAIAADQAQAAIAAFRAFEAANEPIFARHRDAHGHYPRILNLHTAIPELADLFARNRPLLDTLDLLFGSPATLYTSLFYETGSEQSLHRDSPVFATRPDYMYFGATVYLEPTDDDNGCLEVLDRGHLLPEPDRAAMAIRRYGSLDKIPPFDNDFWAEYQDMVRDQGLTAGLPVRKVPLGAGDALIWHPQTPHGGSPIRDRGRTRFSLVMHVIPADMPVYHQNVFFNPDADVPTRIDYHYQRIGDRAVVDQRPNGIGFGHTDVYPLAAFNGVRDAR
jgi:hypothetical protein